MTEKDLKKAYYPTYFSIPNILASQTLVPCRTEVQLPKFGFLAPETNSVDLPVGVHLELPLWAARVMCKPGRTYVSVNIPSGFKDAHRQVMDDDPTCANLREIHPQYFEAGHLCTSLFHNDAGELAEMLPEILQQRILCIGETTIATQENPWIQQIAGSKAVNPEFMDILEHQLYSDSKNASTGVQDWLEPILSSRGGASGSAQPQQQQQSTSQSAHGTHQMTSLQQQQEAAGTSAGHHSMAMSNQNQYQNQQQYAAPTYPPPNYHHTMNTTPAGNVDNSCPMPLNPTARYPPQYYQQ